MEKLHYIVALIAFPVIFCIVLKQQKITGQKGVTHLSILVSSYQFVCVVLKE